MSLRKHSSVHSTNPELDLALLKAGDSGQWDLTFKWLWGIAVSTTKQYLNDQEDAKDAAQEALLDMWEKRDIRLNNVQTLERLPFLTVRIARGKAIDLVREQCAEKRGKGKTESFELLEEKQRNERSKAKAEGIKVKVLEESNLGDHFSKAKPDDSEIDIILENLSEALKPECREILKWRYEEGLKDREIAESLNVGVSSVGIRVKRCLNKLQKELDKYPELKKSLENYRYDRY